MEDGSLRGFDELNDRGGRLAVVRREDARSDFAMRAVVRGASGVRVARGLWRVDWAPGDVICYGADVRLPKGFTAALGDGVDLLRWDNYDTHPDDTDHGGITMWPDGGLRLFRDRLGSDGYAVLLGPYPVAEETWLQIAVEQQLAAAPHRGYSTVYLNGTAVGSAAASSYGRSANAVRFGIVAVHLTEQTLPLELLLDDAFVSDGPCAREQLDPVPEPRVSGRVTASHPRARPGGGNATGGEWGSAA